MAVNEQGHGLRRVVETGPVYVWELWLDGRVVLDVAVSEQDPMRFIRVGRPGWLTSVALDAHETRRTRFAEMVSTDIPALMKLDTRKTGPGEGDVEVVERVSTDSVKFVVGVRLPFMLADVYLGPKEA